MLPALPTEGRFCVRRLKLTEAAMRAISVDFLRLLRGIRVGHRGPRLADWRCLLGSFRRTGVLRRLDAPLDRCDLRFAHKSRPVFDNETRRFQVALQDRTAL